jgi:hypothetical protein
MKYQITSIIVASALIASAALAHHSTAMFDMKQKIALRGTVVKFEWSNPHIWIQRLVPDEKGGASTEWSIEAPAVAGLARAGWRADTLKKGDVITVYLHPLKAGGPGGAMNEVVMADGRHLVQTIIQKIRDESGKKY